MASRATIQVKGLKEILAALPPERLYGRSWRKALRTAAVFTRDLGRSSALVPRGTGRLASQFQMRVDSRPIPLFAKIGTQRNVRGFRVAGALHGSGRYHYRSGPNTGQSTFGWIDRIREQAEPRIEGFLADAAKDVEALWAKVRGA
jgi:hypothetical protein